MSTRELAQYFGISVVTANKILDLLEKQDVVYRIPQSGTFIKHDPPVIPEIVFAGVIPGPVFTNPLKDSATEQLFEYLHSLNIEPRILPYQALSNPLRAEKILANSNGLLLDASFVDSQTLQPLWNYKGKIVVTGNLYSVDELPCSQVIPDLSEPLTEFNELCPLSEYRQIILLEAKHRNSTAAAQSVRSILNCLGISEEQLTVVQLPVPNSSTAFWSAARYFSDKKDLDENTLILSLSDYFSLGIREAYHDMPHSPDILSFDNLEQYDDSFSGTPCLCSIDYQWNKIYQKAVELLCRQLNEKDPCFQLIKVPAKLIMRKSVKKFNPKTEK